MKLSLIFFLFLAFSSPVAVQAVDFNKVLGDFVADLMALIKQLMLEEMMGTKAPTATTPPAIATTPAGPLLTQTPVQDVTATGATTVSSESSPASAVTKSESAAPGATTMSSGSSAAASTVSSASSSAPGATAVSAESSPAATVSSGSSTPSALTSSGSSAPGATTVSSSGSSAPASASTVPSGSSPASPVTSSESAAPGASTVQAASSAGATGSSVTPTVPSASGSPSGPTVSSATEGPTETPTVTLASGATTENDLKCSKHANATTGGTTPPTNIDLTADTKDPTAVTASATVTGGVETVTMEATTEAETTTKKRNCDKGDGDDDVKDTTIPSSGAIEITGEAKTPDTDKRAKREIRVRADRHY